MSGTKGMLHYDRETKQKAVKMFLEEKRSYRAIAEELGIRKSARIEAWVKMFRDEGEISFIKPIGRPLKSESDQHELDRLRDIILMMPQGNGRTPIRLGGFKQGLAAIPRTPETCDIFSSLSF